MADLPGRAVTYVPTNDDFRELLLALHAYFDAGNDDRLMALLRSLKGKRTMVMVSHRRSLLRLCDR